MKKFILAIAVVGASIASNASYLYWQVSTGDADSTFEIDGSNKTWSYAQLHATDGSASYLIGSVAGTENYINGTSQGSDIAVPSGNFVFADLGTYGADSYSYYVELYNSAGTLVARSLKENFSNLQQSQYASTGSVTTELTMRTIPTASMKIWHASGYRAVPEPTSGLMLLLGAAMLGLKRKNRSVA